MNFPPSDLNSNGVNSSDAAAKENATSPSQLPSGEEVENGAGRHWLIRRSLGDVWRGAEARVARWRNQRGAASEADGESAAHPELQSLAASLAGGVVCLDLETCGFAGSCIFLVGLLHETAGDLVLSQLLARDYSEEAAMLHSLWEIVSEKQVLVTFNGKSFDWPCVADRSTLHGLGPMGGARRRIAAEPARSESELAESELSGLAAPAVHCDVLHHARRRWKAHLPNCRLQTLERWICGRRRVGDIPGSEIPAVYHRFARTGDAWELRGVLHHNALDLVTLLQLSMVLATAPNRV
ncbi:MAG: ribonuclease H-like domain-containing protein [Pirellulaceae bacterium]